MIKRIGFGTTLLNRGLSGAGIDGIGQYCQELLNHFSSESSEIELLPYSFGSSGSNYPAHILPRYPTHLIESVFKPNKHLISQKYFGSLDLIHSTDQLIPIIRDKPLVATVMDAIPLSHPEFIKARSRIIKPYIWKKFTARANHIITISEFSKGEIINFMGIPEERITSIPLGVDERFFTKTSEEEVSQILKRFNIFKPYFLFLGSIQPRKNLLKIIRAHSALPSNFATQFPLVIAGKIAWDDGQTIHAIQQGIHENRCVWLNYVTDKEKRALLQATQGLVFASLYEGFGLPIIEAFASRTPVITSNCTSMPEVAGNAAILVNPLDVDCIADALLTLINYPNKREELKDLGFAKAKIYTWQQVAKATKAVYLNL